MEAHVHTDDCTPDNCFRAKVRYIRDSGGLNLATPKMAPGVSFYDTTIKEQQDREMAEARANGWEARVVNPTYDR